MKYLRLYTSLLLLPMPAITSSFIAAQEKDPTLNHLMNQKTIARQAGYPVTAAHELTDQERSFAIKHLTATRQDVVDALKKLSSAQLTHRPGADSWSVEDCIKHIAAAESSFSTMVEESLKKTANPEKRADIKFTDEQLIKAVEDRSHKSKTFSELEPANAPYKTTAEALESFKINRDKLIDFVRNTKQDLRQHISVLPIGTYDAYQFILLISAHTNRHTQQIGEVKANVNFPER
jgi:uncharacterized damage-inducible protein DinB